MAAVETTRRAPLGAIATYRITSVFDRAISAVVDWNDARVTRKSLDKLSDRELDDIGLSRGDIQDIAAGRRA